MSRFVSQALAIPVTENISPITSRFNNRCLYSTPGSYTFTVPAGVCCITAVAVGPGAKQCEVFSEVRIEIPMCNLTRTILHCTSNPMTLSSTIAGGPTTCAHRQSSAICISSTHCQNYQYCAGCTSCTNCLNFSGGTIVGCYSGNGNYYNRYIYIPNGAGGGYAEKALSTAPGCTFGVVVGSSCPSLGTPFSCVQNVVCATGLSVIDSNCVLAGFECFKTPQDLYSSATTVVGPNSARLCYTQTGAGMYSWSKCCFCVIPGQGFGGDINRSGGFSLCCYCASIETSDSCILWHCCYCSGTGTGTTNYFLYGTCADFLKMQHMMAQQIPRCDIIPSSAMYNFFACCGCMGIATFNIQALNPGQGSCGTCNAFGIWQGAGSISGPFYSPIVTMFHAHRCFTYNFVWQHEFTNLGNVCSFAACAPGTYDLTCGGTHFNCLKIVDTADFMECYCGGSQNTGVVSGPTCVASAFLHAHMYHGQGLGAVATTPFYKFGGSSAGNNYGPGTSSLSDGPTYSMMSNLCSKGMSLCSEIYCCMKCTDCRCPLYDVAGYAPCNLWFCDGPTWTCDYSPHVTTSVWNLSAAHCVCSSSYGTFLACAYDLAQGAIHCFSRDFPTCCICWYNNYNTPCHFVWDFLNWFGHSQCRCKLDNRGIFYNPCIPSCSSGVNNTFMCLCIGNGGVTSFNTAAASTYNEDVTKFGFEPGVFFTCEQNSDTLPIVVHQALRGPIKPRVSRLVDSAVSNFAFKGDHFTVSCCHVLIRLGGVGCGYSILSCAYNTSQCGAYGWAAGCGARSSPWTRYNYYGTCYDNHNNFYCCTFGVAVIGCHLARGSFGQPSHTDAIWNYCMSYTGIHCNYPCCLGYNYTTSLCKPPNRNPLINVFDYICTTMMSNRNQVDSTAEACLILCNWKGWFDHNKYSLGIPCFNNFLSALYAACATYDSTYCCIFESFNCLQVCDSLFGIGQVHTMCFSYGRYQTNPRCNNYTDSTNPCYNCNFCGNPHPITPRRCATTCTTPLVCFRNNRICCNSVCLCCNPACYEAQGGAGTATAGTWSSQQASCTLVCTTGGCICCVQITNGGKCMTCAPFVNINCVCGGVGAVLDATVLGCSIFCVATNFCTCSAYLAGITIRCPGNGFICAPSLTFCYDSWFLGLLSTYGGCICPCAAAYIAPNCAVYCCVTAYQSLGSGGGTCSGINNIPKCIDVVDSSIIKSVRTGRGGRGNEVDYEPYYYSYPGISAQLAIPINPACFIGDAAATGCSWFDVRQIRGSGGNGTFTSAYLACVPAQGPGPGGGGPVGCDGSGTPRGTGGVLGGGGGCGGFGGLGGGAGWAGNPGTGMVVIYWNT